MAWDPDIAVFDERYLNDNLIAFLEANQTDALYWANENAGGLPDIREFYKSPRTVKLFPAFTIINSDHTAEFEDILSVELNMVFEFALVHGNQDTLTDRSKKYMMAIESMLSNLPKTTFTTDSYIVVNATLNGLETVYDVQGQVKANQFIQVSQMRAQWALTAAART